MDLKFAAAYWRLGALPGEKLPGIAQAALLDGYDTESLRVLAGEQPAPKSELGELFERTLSECQVSDLSEPESALEIARYHAEKILSGEVSPYEGAKAIVQEAAQAVQPIPEEILAFVGLEDEFVDFGEQSRVQFYGKERCEAIRRELERRIMQEAGQLVAESV